MVTVVAEDYLSFGTNLSSKWQQLESGLQSKDYLLREQPNPGQVLLLELERCLVTFHVHYFLNLDPFGQY